jgi:hypothetical protein
VRAALSGTAGVLLVTLAGASVAASPSPSPSPGVEDRTTTVSVSPTAAPDRAPIVLRGFSDCAVIDGHLLFTTYDGKADNVVVRRTSTTYDYAREKYPFTIRLTVPVTAAPGRAKVYAEPFCGPPEEYPASTVAPFVVERSRLALRLSPRRPRSGDRLRVRVRTCDGGHGRLTVRVREGTAVRDLDATVDAAGAAALSVRVTSAGDVSLPFAAAQCRGSSYAGAAAYAVRPTTSKAPEPTPAATTSSIEPTPSAAGPGPASTAPTAEATAAPRAATSSDDGSAPWLGVAAAALVAGAAGAVVVALVRRRTPP